MGTVVGQSADDRMFVRPHRCVLKSGAVIGYPAGNAKMQKNAEFLAAFLKDQTGMVLKTAEGEGDITLQLGMQDENPEAYQLKVNSDGIVISAPSEAGVFYGIQTLRKSVSAAPDSQVEFPAVEIVDKPRFGYRGMMLDVGRHFFSMDELKTYIDMLALHNINRFHWHLSEDQGWHRNQEISEADRNRFTAQGNGHRP